MYRIELATSWYMIVRFKIETEMWVYVRNIPPIIAVKDWVCHFCLRGNGQTCLYKRSSARALYITHFSCRSRWLNSHRDAKSNYYFHFNKPGYPRQVWAIALDQILETVITFHFSGGKVYSLNKGCHTCMTKHTIHVQSLHCSRYLTWLRYVHIQA